MGLMKKIFFTVTAVIITNQVLPAQDTLKLSIEQAIDIGLKNSKTLHASLMNVKAAEAQSGQADAALLPSLKLTAAYRRLSFVEPYSISTPFGVYEISPSILDNYTSILTLSQPLFTGFRLLNNSRIAEKNYEAASEEYNRNKSELVFNIKNAYWNLYKAIELKKAVDENVEQIKAHLNDANNLLKVGMFTENDVLKLQVQLSDAQLKQLDANNNIQLATVSLNNVLSIPLNTQINITSGTEYEDNKMENMRELINAALQNRPEIKAAKYRVESGEYNLTAAQSGWYPQISLAANYYYSKPNQRIFPSQNKFSGTWDLGVNFSVNIWDWMTTKHQSDAAEALLSQSKDLLGSTKDQIVLEVTQNYLTLNLAKQKIELAELSVRQAQENMRVTSERFKSGLVLSSDAIDAEVALLVARTNFTTSIVDYEIAKARLEKSIGK